jgi:glucitol/sorbitol PTS system EIIA component
MTTKYHTTVTSVGEMAAEFAAEGILVFFGPDAPEELHEFAIITTAAELAAPVEVGDTVHIDEAAFPVLSVGRWPTTTWPDWAISSSSSTDSPSRNCRAM